MSVDKKALKKLLENMSNDDKETLLNELGGGTPDKDIYDTLAGLRSDIDELKKGKTEKTHVEKPPDDDSFLSSLGKIFK